MPHISIYLDSTSASASVISVLRTMTGRAISDLTKAIPEGRPLFDGELFARPREDTLHTVLSLLEQLERLGVCPIIKESGYEISKAILRNIAEASEESMARLRKLDDLGHA